MLFIITLEVYSLPVQSLSSCCGFLQYKYSYDILFFFYVFLFHLGIVLLLKLIYKIFKKKNDNIKKKFVNKISSEKNGQTSNKIIPYTERTVIIIIINYYNVSKRNVCVQRI